MIYQSNSTRDGSVFLKDPRWFLPFVRLSVGRHLVKERHVSPSWSPNLLSRWCSAPDVDVDVRAGLATSTWKPTVPNLGREADPR
jgi:hypothetical protein